MTDDQFSRYLNYVTTVLGLHRRLDGHEAKWSLAFGALLDFTRFKDMPQQDFDISMIYGEVFEHNLVKAFIDHYGFELVSRILDDKRKYPLKLTLKPKAEIDMGDMCLDIFCWYKHNNIYYHTYDYYNENPANGVPSKYYLKGIDAEIFEAPIYKQYWTKKQRHYQEQEIRYPYEMNIPMCHGSMLDIWYPMWLIEDKQFGVSKSPYILELQTFDQFRDENLIQTQLEKSRAEYDEFVKSRISRAYG